MTTATRPADPGHDSDADEQREQPDFDLEKRTVRAAEEAMTVVAIAPEMFEVYTAPDSTGDDDSYVVDTRDGACLCPDHQYNDPRGGCKHRRRVQMVLGQREIPFSDGVDTDAQLVGQFKLHATRGLDGLGYVEASDLEPTPAI